MKIVNNLKFQILNCYHHLSFLIWVLLHEVKVIHYDGILVQRDILKSIKYYKKASCFNIDFAKNNLGIIYKNGDGVDKNIYNAIEYFNEAKKINNNSYSLINLARIYYFGIDIEKNIHYSIELLNQISDDYIVLGNLFLYYIYTFGYKSIINEQKSYMYRNNSSIYNILNNLKDLISDDLLSKRMEFFFKEYDFVYTMKNICLYDFNIFMMTESFIKHQNKWNDNKNNKLKDINDDFYKGFYDE